MPLCYRRNAPEPPRPVKAAPQPESFQPGDEIDWRPRTFSRQIFRRQREVFARFSLQSEHSISHVHNQDEWRPANSQESENGQQSKSEKSNREEN